MSADFCLGDWHIQPTLNRATRDGRAIHIRPKVMDLLVVLSSQPGVVLSKDALVDAAWAAEFVSDSALTSVIAEMRQVFHDDAERPWLIETIPKRGYRLIAAVRPAVAAGETAALPKLDRPSEGPRLRRIGFAALVVTTAAAAVAAVWLNATVTGDRTTGAGTPIQDLAVLPFQNLSGSPADDVMADGITGGVISELARLDGFHRVIAHESVMRFKAPRPSMKEVVSELRVQALITGSVARTDNRITVRVELVDGLVERQIWSGVFVREADAAIDVQRQVVRDIVREARIHLSPRQRQRLEAAGRRTNPEAYELLVKARRESARINYAATVSYCEQALSRDPEMADAWAELALTLVYQGYGNPAHTVIPRARAAADRALALDPDSTLARIALGRIRLHVDWDWDGAGVDLQSAATMDPHRPEARWSYGFYLGVMGRMDEAVQEAREAVRLDPLSPMTRYALAFQLRVARQYQNSIDEFTRAIALAPDRPLFVAQRALTHAMNGSCALADADLAASGRTAFAAFVAAKCGRREEARRSAASMRAGGRCAPDVYTALGDYDAAFACLEEQYTRRDFLLAQFATAPVLIGLPHDERFEGLLRRMGYPR